MALSFAPDNPEYGHHDAPELVSAPEKLETFLAHGAVVVDNDIVRWTLEIPPNEHLVYNGLAVFCPGYMGIKRSSRLPRNALAQAGLATLSISPAREGCESMQECITDPQKLHVDALLAVADDLRENRFRLAQTLPGFRAIDIDRKLMVPHSMSGLSVPRYALKETSAVEAIYGLATVGLGGPKLEHLAVDIPRGLLGSFKHEVVPAIKLGVVHPSLGNLREFGRYALRLRTLFEGLSCLNHNAVDDVQELADKGIPYHYEAYERDILVRPNPHLADIVNDYELIEGYGHLAPQVKAPSVAGRIAVYAASL